jgi:uncharacterized low-complexity protein
MASEPQPSGSGRAIVQFNRGLGIVTADRVNEDKVNEGKVNEGKVNEGKVNEGKVNEGKKGVST